MKRLLVLALVGILGNSSLALAEETLLTAGARHVQQLSRTEAAVSRPPATMKPVIRLGAPAAAAMQGSGPKTLQSSGIGKGAKWLIALGAAAAFVGTVYAIDQNVEDSTPSSLGTRRD